jgi:hypothetical protein
MQDAITLLIVALAAGYSIYLAVGTFFMRKKTGGCGGGCCGCPAGKEKGEPIQLVPLQGLSDSPPRIG